ncbi:MAG: uncharacterized protein KVP18_002969 [Porospora cf. gigantea A]|uniref:uncharacterized protein n=1 Tax=Porospora cf. gigantea A TaxID=2853593 RepID=UPI00355A709E|nr:MAG: hypothetical protein KVP18_002969 [Porospora cf. gigantea A]
MVQTASPDDRFAFWRREYSRLRRQQHLALADENEGLLRMKLCLYDDRSTASGSVVGEAVFVTDRRDAMALVALVAFVSAAMPLMVCAAYSCYDIKFKRIRIDLRKYRLRQQRDAVRLPSAGHSGGDGAISGYWDVG